jgi:CRP-like cAMP-binding protein
MTWHDWLGNVSYLLIAASYMVTSMLWLRMLAILGLATEAVYFYVVGSSSLWVAIGWSMVFLAINAVQLTRLLRELQSLTLQGDERFLKSHTFAALSLLSFRRLMKAGRWQTLAPGAVLTVQHQPVTHLRVLVGGMASVVVDGMQVATIRAAGIVGEMSLLTGDTASATVTVTQPARVFEIASAELSRLLHDHEDLRAEFHQALGSELSAKVVALRGKSARDLPMDTGMRA